jgi:hypothetical protein
MSVEERLAVLKQVSQIATLAGLKGVIDDDAKFFKMLFQLGEGRDQLVLIRHTGKTPQGQNIVTFYSTCLVLKEGLLSGISKEQAIDLLRRNEGMMFARFGIWQVEKQTSIVVSVDSILETLDPEEIANIAWYTAYAADNYEKEFGKDDF